MTDNVKPFPKEKRLNSHEELETMALERITETIRATSPVNMVMVFAAGAGGYNWYQMTCQDADVVGSMTRARVLIENAIVDYINSEGEEYEH